jgi:hypothetical protein
MLAVLPIVTGPPIDSQPHQPLFGSTCQMCHKALSVPRTKTSKRPSALTHHRGEAKGRSNSIDELGERVYASHSRCLSE